MQHVTTTGCQLVSVRYSEPKRQQLSREPVLVIEALDQQAAEELEAALPELRRRAKVPGLMRSVTPTGGLRVALLPLVAR